ncbi:MULTISPECIES: hypothetical protein [Cupriavidus]
MPYVKAPARCARTVRMPRARTAGAPMRAAAQGNCVVHHIFIGKRGIRLFGGKLAYQLL